MEERGLRVAKTDKAFFSKISTTISKLLIPTKIGINGMLITLKRNNVLKNYELLKDNKEQEKEEIIQKKYEDSFILYLESIDKYVMDSIYKKVKNKSATRFEEEALSRYYEVIHLKETQYIEYKYRKQKYLLDLDYMSLDNDNKSKIISKYVGFYVSKMNGIYKGILKNYSIQLADKMSAELVNKETIYENIFGTLEDYIENILPLKIKVEGKDEISDILGEYEKADTFLAGKLDERDQIEKKMHLLAVSRKLFTHSLPLVVAEQCYEKLLNEARKLIIDTKLENKKEKAYDLLINLIEEYNKFWEEYKNIEEGEQDKQIQKEILFIKNEIKKLEKDDKQKEIVKFYKDKLVQYGVLRIFKNNYKKIDNKKYLKKAVRV